MLAIGRLLRRVLDGLYLAGGVLAAISLVGILVVIVLQMAARWSGVIFPGSAAYAGYCMAASSFLALAYALNNGAHIRVTLILGTLGSARRWGETWCFGIGTLIATYFAWYAVKAVYWSHKLKDVSQDQDATPLWIPQAWMAAGAILFAIALADHFLRVMVYGTHGIEAEILDDNPQE